MRINQSDRMHTLAGRLNTLQREYIARDRERYNNKNIVIASAAALPPPRASRGLTVSSGVATLLPGESAPQFLARSGAILAHDKNGGNRVLAAPEADPVGGGPFPSDG